jgi:hypothetical protein
MGNSPGDGAARRSVAGLANLPPLLCSLASANSPRITADIVSSVRSFPMDLDGRTDENEAFDIRPRTDTMQLRQVR